MWWHHPVSVWVCADGSRGGPQSAASVCVKSAQSREGGGGRSSTSQNLLTHKWNSQWVATGGSETSDRSELGERPGLGVGGDISWWEEERGKWTNSEAWMLWCVMSGGGDVRASVTHSCSPLLLSWPDPGERKVHWVIRERYTWLLWGERGSWWLLVYLCGALSCVILCPGMARTRNTEFATRTNITARVVHTRALTTNDFQDLYFLAPSSPRQWPPHAR